MSLTLQRVLDGARYPFRGWSIYHYLLDGGITVLGSVLLGAGLKLGWGDRALALVGVLLLATAAISWWGRERFSKGGKEEGFGRQLLFVKANLICGGLLNQEHPTFYVEFRGVSTAAIAMRPVRARGILTIMGDDFMDEMEVVGHAYATTKFWIRIARQLPLTVATDFKKSGDDRSVMKIAFKELSITWQSEGEAQATEVTTKHRGTIEFSAKNDWCSEPLLFDDPSAFLLI